MIYIVMGVSGSGKSTLGKQLANLIKLPFYDGDDYHPQANIQKMSQSQPLDDHDRYDWLYSLSQHMKIWEQDGGAVLACSALKESYRKTLSKNSNLKFTMIYLKGSFEFIEKRLSQRSNHFMCNSLLKSQFETLEEPQNAIIVSIEDDLNMMCQKILDKLPSNISVV